MSMSIGLGLFALICLGSVPIFVAMYFLVPKRHHRSYSRVLISWGFRAYLKTLSAVCGITAEATELRKLNDQRLIIIANHPSLLDAVILFACFPCACCIIKASLLQNVLFGVGARMAGYISNQDAGTMMEQARQELDLGGQLIIFPESGRTRSFPISPFSTASSLISKMTDTPIQCVFLDFSTPYLGKDWGLFTPPVIPLKIDARIGDQIAPPSNATRACQELETYYRNEVRAAWIPTKS
jgi:1-acyl-sn-glycerol-3-phosphate acyltransferase